MMRSTTRFDKHLLPGKRRGVVLAVCMVSLFVISVIASSILMTLSIEKSGLKLQQNLVKYNYQLDQIGDLFVSGTLSVEDGKVTGYPEYKCVISDDGHTLTVTNDADTVLLVVEKDASGKILSWRSGTMTEVDP